MATAAPLHAGRKTWCILAIALGFAVIASLLPENAYQRWQLLDGTIHARARWIYERLHDDPTPIDVAFVGPSRVEAGVSAPRLAAKLAERGLPANVVNFSLPETGRNINALVVDEMLSTKRPRLLVIGVIEKPSRFGHSAFKYIAPRKMLVDPGYFGNINYLSDLIYVPFRSMKLFAADLFPKAMGLDKEFNPNTYRGSVVETTGDVRLPDGQIKNGSQPASLAELHRGVTKLERGTNPPILGPKFADVEFGDERYFIRHIAAAAQRHGVKVVFLALPYYTGPSTLQEADLYSRYGKIWNAGFLSTHPELYSDYAHVDTRGAEVLTDWLVEPVAAELEKAQ